mmetsp:Transcript_54926/g.91286  ORF Transcript_54926/g.91286 Transcript_54926/m.91286 type:complete len:648 (-) Transcript_54926:76-2019(-)
MFMWLWCAGAVTSAAVSVSQGPPLTGTYVLGLINHVQFVTQTRLLAVNFGDAFNSLLPPALGFTLLRPNGPAPGDPLSTSDADSMLIQALEIFGIIFGSILALHISLYFLLRLYYIRHKGLPALPPAPSVLLAWPKYELIVLYLAYSGLLVSSSFALFFGSVFFRIMGALILFVFGLVFIAVAAYLILRVLQKNSVTFVLQRDLKLAPPPVLLLAQTMRASLKANSSAAPRPPTPDIDIGRSGQYLPLRKYSYGSSEGEPSSLSPRLDLDSLKKEEEEEDLPHRPHPTSSTNGGDSSGSFIPPSPEISHEFQYEDDDSEGNSAERSPNPLPSINILLQTPPPSLVGKLIPFDEVVVEEPNQSLPSDRPTPLPTSLLDLPPRERYYTPLRPLKLDGANHINVPPSHPPRALVSSLPGQFVFIEDIDDQGSSRPSLLKRALAFFGGIQKRLVTGQWQENIAANGGRITIFLSTYGFLFDSYDGRRIANFAILFDLSKKFLLALLIGSLATSGSSGALAQSSLLLVIWTAHLLYLSIVRPFRDKVENTLQVLVCAFEAAVFAVAIAALLGQSADGVQNAMIYLTFISMILLLIDQVRVSIDVLQFLLVLFLFGLRRVYIASKRTVKKMRWRSRSSWDALRPPTSNQIIYL